MIEIVSTITDGACELSMTGHAGAADPGEDTICAAASMLLYTLAQTIHNMHCAGFLAEEPELRVLPGDGLVRAKPQEGYEGDVGMAYAVIETGCILLQHTFGDYVRAEILKGDKA